MMTKKQSKRTAGLKLLFVIPATALLVMCFSFSYAQQTLEELVVTAIAPTKIVAVTAVIAPTAEVVAIVEIQEVSKEAAHKKVENMPSYNGGTKALYEFLGSNIKYPTEAQKKGIQGKVYVQFVVEKDGSLSEIKILRGIGSGCDKEAIRIVAAMPKWKPGKIDGKAVRVEYVLPINYKLQ